MSNTTTAAVAASNAASGYYGTNPVIRALRLALGAAQRLWPGLGARFLSAPPR